MSKAVPRRWLVLGAGGAGKTTLALALGEILHLPTIHLDRQYWRPGWVEPSRDDWDRTVLELAARDQWIMDGNYSRTLHLRLPRADAVILLDPPTIVCLLGVIQRGWLQRSGMRPDLADGCAEHPPDLQFLRYVATYKRRSRPQVLRMVRAAPHAPMIHLRSRREARAFLKNLQQQRQRGSIARAF